MISTLERYLPEIVVTVLLGLLALVRRGDVERISKVEKKADDAHVKVSTGEVRIYDRIDAHAVESRAQAEQLRSWVAERLDHAEARQAGQHQEIVRILVGK